MTPLNPTPWQARLAGAPRQSGSSAALAFNARAGSLPMLPMVPSACQLMPRFWMTWRDISAMRTRRVTCREDWTVIWFSTSWLSAI